MSARAVPVIVLAGFLGSGKTTLLNHLLAHAGDTRVGVVVNDFGSVGVDAMLVGRSIGGVVPLGGGCLCCSADAATLGPLLDRLTGARSELDVVVIEASGIAEPDRVVAMVHTSGSKRAAFGGLVEVVDAAQFEDVRTLHTELDRHVGLADLVVVNKTGLAGAERTERVRALCRAVNERAPVVLTDHGALDPRLLFDVVVRPGRQLMLAQEPDDHAHGSHDEHQHLHDAYRVVEFATDRPLDPDAFVTFLRERDPDAYRVKGFAAFGGGRDRFVVHAVGRHLRLEHGAWARGLERRTGIEVIGRGIDTADVRAALAACERDEPADAAALAALTPYLA